MAQYVPKHVGGNVIINPLNAELNPICHLLALLAHHILHVSRIRVNAYLLLCVYFVGVLTLILLTWRIW